MGMNNLHQALQKNFGFSEFRSPQEEVIKTILEGRDSLVIMPTGKGKSLATNSCDAPTRGHYRHISPYCIDEGPSRRTSSA